MCLNDTESNKYSQQSNMVDDKMQEREMVQKEIQHCELNTVCVAGEDFLNSLHAGPVGHKSSSLICSFNFSLSIVFLFFFGNLSCKPETEVEMLKSQKKLGTIF